MPTTYFTAGRGLLFWAVALGYVTACGAGFIEFHVWSQVRTLVHTTPSEWATHALFTPSFLYHPHFMRTLAVLPSMLIAEAFEFEDDAVFSAFAGFCMVIVSLCVNVSHSYLVPPRRRTLDVAVLASFILVSLFMNGRMCIGLCGSAILIWAHLGWLIGKKGFFQTYFWSILALLLTSVSGGAFVLAAGIVIIWASYWVRGIQQGRRRMPKLREVVAMLVFVAAGGFQARLFLEKNLIFYDVAEFEEAWILLEHGMGGYLTDSLDASVFVFATYALLALTMLSFHVWISLGHKPLMTYMVAVSLFGLFCGLFGYSTLAASLPTAALLLKGLVLMSVGRARVPACVHQPRFQSIVN